MPSNGEYMQKRIVGYDIMKSLSIYLVVLIHFGFYVPVTGDTLVNNFVLILTNVGVPLFLWLMVPCSFLARLISSATT